jgi:hypothetical protein
MRTLAGFRPDPGSFFIQSGAIDPPASLLKKIFPDVEVWLSRMERGDGCETKIAAGGSYSCFNSSESSFFRILFF